jgi:hypothetical protein
MILLEVEKVPHNSAALQWVELERTIYEYSPQDISYHVLLLKEAGLIQATNVRLAWRPIRLTWEGHEFLDTAKDNNRWEKAKNAMTKTGGFALDVMKQLLIQYLKSELNLGG